MWKHPRKGEQPCLRRPRVPQTEARKKTFDAETGQIFTEYWVRSATRQHSDWIGEFKTPSLVKSVQPADSKGARKLSDVAKTSAVKHLRSISREHLAMVPWGIAKEIWREIVASHRESFHAWRIFAASYPCSSEFGGSEYRYHLHIRQPSLPVPDYVRGLTSDELHWMTCLRVSPKETRIADLVSLSSATNLVILDLSDGQVAIDTKTSSFEERVLRTWAELAKMEGSFEHLRVILLGWQEHVSTWLFKYLGSFPSLRHVILTDCPRIHQKNRKDWGPIAVEYGWEARHAKRSAKSLRPVLNEPGFSVGAISGLLYSKPDALSHAAETRKTEIDPKSPVLECWLGTPKPWTHILDDFPGTRTIFFDRVPCPSQGGIGHQDTVSSDPVKRARDQGRRSVDMRSPPPKRASKPGLKLRPEHKGALDLLTEFSQR